MILLKHRKVKKIQYDKSFKEETVKLSDEIGVKAAAAQLGIPYYTLSGWRNNRKNTDSIRTVETVINECLLILWNSISVNLKRKMQNSNMRMRFYRRPLFFSHNAERSKSSSALSVHSRKTSW